MKELWDMLVDYAVDKPEFIQAFDEHCTVDPRS